MYSGNGAHQTNYLVYIWFVNLFDIKKYKEVYNTFKYFKCFKYLSESKLQNIVLTQDAIVGKAIF